MTSFWSSYITLLTIGTLVAVTVLLFITRKGERKGTTDQTMGHTFDGIEEYDNPLPKWWFWMFLGTVIFGVLYFILYPGLGTWKGVLPGYEEGWTGVNQYRKEMAKAEEQYGPLFTKYASMPIEEVAKDPQALKMGGRIFASTCSVCHGSDAKGAHGFPNLTDNDWLYGGEPATIKTSIMEGRKGMMPAWLDVIGEPGIQNTAAYVRSLSGLKQPEGSRANLAEGQKIFQSNCAVCHGPEGKGTHAMGAPDLTDRVWLYGSSASSVQQTLRYGRNGNMPSHKDFLGNDKAHLVAAYVYSLSHKATEK